MRARNYRLLPILALVFAVLACNMPTPTPVATPSATDVPVVTEEAPTEEAVNIPANVRGPAFAQLVEIPYALPERYDGYTLPVDPGQLSNGSQFPLSQAQVQSLAQNGFVVTPGDWLEFFQVYDNVRYAEQPVFVTTDSVYHVYHLIFDKMLRDLEREHFAPDIAALSRACLQTAQADYAAVQGTSLEGTARSVLAYFAVADALSNPDAVAPPEVADLVAQELALIEAHGGLNPSPIFGQACPGTCNPCDTNPPPECLDQPCMCEDYSQYVPRGHYTRSEQLERYFRTMMWYGRINMRLQKPEETRMALLITHILKHTNVGGEPAVNLWARVYDPTAFIVGKADDLGYYEYNALWDSIYGPGAPITDLTDDAKLAEFTATARQLPPPQINSMFVYIWEDEEQVTQGFRFMGQRFVLDAYIFEQLVWREVGTQENPRWLPRGLDVMAALGSDEAYAILEAEGETAYANYPENMTKLRSEIGGLQIDSWTQTLYWAWLYALQPLLQPKGEQYPSFMRTQAWTRKDIHTALGSWTELKHDTILYAKQVMAEMGGGGEPPEPPRAYVEPNPAAYARLLALTRMTYEGLNGRGLLNETTRDNLSDLDSLLTFLLDVSQRELRNETLSNDDYNRLKYYGGTLEALTLASSDPEEGESEGRSYFDEDDQAPIVADVATDPNGQVLEQATGRIFNIYVVVPDGRGNLQIAQGGVYSYYEFAWPMSDRLTDEAWRAMLDAGQQPARPQWTGTFIVE